MMSVLHLLWIVPAAFLAGFVLAAIFSVGRK